MMLQKSDNILALRETSASDNVQETSTTTASTIATPDKAVAHTEKKGKKKKKKGKRKSISMTTCFNLNLLRDLLKITKEPKSEG